MYYKEVELHNKKKWFLATLKTTLQFIQLQLFLFW